MAPNPPKKAHSFANFQICKNYSFPLPSQILGTPLLYAIQERSQDLAGWWKFACTEATCHTWPVEYRHGRPQEFFQGGGGTSLRPKRKGAPSFPLSPFYNIQCTSNHVNLIWTSEFAKILISALIPGAPNRGGGLGGGGLNPPELSAWPEVRGTADTDGGAYSPFRSILLVLTHDFIIIQPIYGPACGDG